MTSPQSPSWQLLQDLIAGRELSPRQLGVRMQLVHHRCRPGKWEGEVLFDRSAENNQGVIHGGFLATVLDISMGYASLSLLDPDQRQRTLEMSTHFLRGIPPDRVLVDGECLRRGGRTSYCEGTVRTREGEIVARGTATFYVRRSSPDETAR